jgi:hypothetical protein
VRALTDGERVVGFAIDQPTVSAVAFAAIQARLSALEERLAALEAEVKRDRASASRSAGRRARVPSIQELDSEPAPQEQPERGRGDRGARRDRPRE